MIGLIEPSTEHYYQPLWTLVGAGLKSLADSRRPMDQVLADYTGHPRVPLRWLGSSTSGSASTPGSTPKPTPTSAPTSAVRRIEPARNQVWLEDGGCVRYDYLVVAAGIQVLWARVPGLRRALDDHQCPVTTNYHQHYVNKTAALLHAGFQYHGGSGQSSLSTSSQSSGSGSQSSSTPTTPTTSGFTALFTQPSTPIKCAGAAQKICYLAEETWRRKGLRTTTEVSLLVSWEGTGVVGG